VELVDHDTFIEHGDRQGDIQGLLVDHERRSVVHLIGANRLPVDPVDDLLFRFELHQSGAVILAELGQRRPHVAENLGVVGAAVPARRAAAEELLFGQQLLVDFQAGLEPDGGIVLGVISAKGLKIKS